jgi:hypothetical protein
METFVIGIGFEENNCECFVQKIKSATEDVYLISFKDSCLIKQFRTKRMVCASDKTGLEKTDRFYHHPTHIPDSFAKDVWRAIKSNEKKKFLSF